MLQIRGLGKSFGSKVLFEDADVFLGEKQKVALIGPNGSGKSTLIKLILGQDHSEQGEIQKGRHVRIGHLAQELPKFENRTLREEVMRLDGRREEILKAKAELEELLTTDASEVVLSQYARILEEFELFDEYRLPSRAEQIMEGVGFQPKDYDRNLSEFSGGWLMRAALARVLLLGPDLLVLDEPTNHLDLESLLWLEEFLRSYPGSLLLVSHDRAFVNRLVESVWEIDQHKINVYSGNLDAYVVQKEERLKVLEAARAGQEAKIAEMRAFVDRFGAKATKARQAQSRMKQIEKIEATMTDLPEERQNVNFSFPSCPPSGKEVITFKKGAVRFPDKTIFQNLDWILPRGARVAIVGVNGAGKTTLLKILAHQLRLTEGSIKLGHQVQIGYYSQMQAESLDLERTILEELENTAPQLTLAQVRGVAGAFLFTGESVYKRIKVLSGGEKARVALAKLLLTPHNFLLLDEPTNHLDAESRGVLLQALTEYEGTLCLVSHDRDFVAPLVDQLLEMNGGEVIPLIQTYEEYLAKKIQETRDRIKSGTSSSQKPEKKENTETSKKSDKPSNNQIRNWNKEFATLEGEILKLEEKLGTLNHQLSTEDFSSNPSELRKLIDEQSEKQLQLDQKLARWEEVGGLIAQWGS
jgi:ATP-binding cassette subfamily F protein 3